MKAYQNITELIGNTPLLRLGRLATDAEIYAKCEFMNPLSLKDRPVLQIIQDAEESGQLKPGGALIEATSGNTGMAVASIAAVRDYKAVLVMSEIQSLERSQSAQGVGRGTHPDTRIRRDKGGEEKVTGDSGRKP